MNNDLEQFTEERLKQVEASGLWSRLSHAESQALARIALAAKQAKPVVDIEPLATAIMKTIDAETDKFHSAYTLSELRIAIVKTLSALTTPQPAHTEQDGWVSIPKDMLADYRDVKNGEIQTYKASFGSHCDIPDSRWQRDLADLTEELAEIDKLIAAAPKPESE